MSACQVYSYNEHARNSQPFSQQVYTDMTVVCCSAIMYVYTFERRKTAANGGDGGGGGGDSPMM